MIPDLPAVGTSGQLSQGNVRGSVRRGGRGGVNSLSATAGE